MKRCHACGERFNPVTYTLAGVTGTGRYCGQCDNELAMALDEERDAWDDDEERATSHDDDCPCYGDEGGEA